MSGSAESSSHERQRSRELQPHGHHAVAAGLFLVAWLSFIAFIALYRAPLPSDAFTALTFDLIARADHAVTR